MASLHRFQSIGCLMDGVSTDEPSDARASRGQRPSRGLPAGVTEQWRSGITSEGNHNHPETDFTTEDPVYWFAGQHEVQDLPAPLRTAFARLVVRTLPLLTDAHKRSTWKRQRPGGSNTVIETPLASFLTNANWVPVAVPPGTVREFRPPSESWYVGAEDTMAAAYSPLVEPPLRALMNSVEVGDRHWKPLDS